MLEGLEPIVWGAPPLASSKFEQGRRLFIDGRVDRNGFPRRLKKGDEDSPDDPKDPNSDDDFRIDDDHHETKRLSRRLMAMGLEYSSDSASESAGQKFGTVNMPQKIRSKPDDHSGLSIISILSDSEEDPEVTTQPTARLQSSSQSGLEAQSTLGTTEAPQKPTDLKRRYRPSEEPQEGRGKGKGKGKGKETALVRNCLWLK